MTQPKPPIDPPSEPDETSVDYMEVLVMLLRDAENELGNEDLTETRYRFLEHRVSVLKYKIEALR